MNNTATKLTDAAWSKLETLSTMRRFIQSELDHSHSFPPGFSSEKLERALSRIDSFSSDFSKFLAAKNAHSHSDHLEEQFDELSHGYSALMQDIETIVGH